MSSEYCPMCENDVPFSDTIHLLIHTRDEDTGIIDHYICRTCYEEQLFPLFTSETTGSPD